MKKGFSARIRAHPSKPLNFLSVYFGQNVLVSPVCVSLLFFLYILFCFYILRLWPSRSETEAHKTFAAASFAFFMQCRRSQVNAFLALIVQLYCLSGINCSCSCIVWSSLRFGFGRDAYRWSQNRMEVLYNPKA